MSKQYDFKNTSAHSINHQLRADDLSVHAHFS